MRTVILLGLTAIASAINDEWITDSSTIKFMAIVLLVAIFMDVTDFLNGCIRKK